MNRIRIRIRINRSELEQNQNEIRLEVGYEVSDDPNLNTHHITKNYTKLTESEGGEKTNETDET